MAAKFKASPELVSAFAQANGSSAGAGFGALRVDVKDEIFVQVGSTANFASPDAFDPSALIGDGTSACYLMVQQPVHRIWALVSFIPEGCKVKDRMLYASGRDALKQQLGASNFASGEIHTTDAEELRAKSFVEDASRRKEYQGGTKTDFLKTGTALGAALANPRPLTPKMKGMTLNDALTEDERTAQLEQRAAAAEAGALGMAVIGGRGVTGAAVSFPPTDAAKAAVEAFAAGSGGGVIFALKSEHIDVAAELAEGTCAALADALRARPGNEPSFALLRFAPPSVTAPVSVLFTYCPENAPISAKMMSSSARPAVRALIEGASVELAKAVETQDMDDVNDDWLGERVVPAAHGEEDGAQAVRRPAPKGGRRIIRKDE